MILQVASDFALRACDGNYTVPRSSDHRSLAGSVSFPRPRGRFVSENMLRSGEATCAYVGSVVGDCRVDRLRHLGVAPHELWMKFGEQADHVVDHQDLSVAGDRGTDPYGRRGNPIGYSSGKRFSSLLDHHAERAGVCDRFGIRHDRRCFGLRTAARRRSLRVRSPTAGSGQCAPSPARPGS